MNLSTDSQLNFIELGDPSNESLTLIHGFLGSNRDWEETLDSLKENYHCIAIELPSHGDSRPGSNNSTDSMANSVFEILKGIGVNSSTILGYSLGGRVALSLYKNYPQAVNALILESTSPGLKTEAESQQRIIEDKKWATLLSENPEDFLKNWETQSLFSNKFETNIKRSIKNSDELSKFLLESSPALNISNWDLYIKVNTLFITGEHDKKYYEIINQFRKHQPNSEHTVISNAFHNTHLDNTKEFNKTVNNFLISINKKGVTHAHS
jgi:2-succinyl-6-hydroxy-2,4-cyclohexadiene-1-carboxylate synthase